MSGTSLVCEFSMCLILSFCFLVGLVKGYRRRDETDCHAMSSLKDSPFQILLRASRPKSLMFEDTKSVAFRSQKSTSVNIALDQQ